MSPRDVAAFVLKGKRPSFEEHGASKAPAALKALIESCWHANPAVRPSVHDVGVSFATLAASITSPAAEVEAPTLASFVAQPPTKASLLPVKQSTTAFARDPLESESGAIIVAKLLASAGLEDYTGFLVQLGVTDPESLSDSILLDGATLTKAGMTELEIRKFRSLCRSQSQKPQEAAVSGAATAREEVASWAGRKSAAGVMI